MAESNPTEGLQAALNSSIERQKELLAQEEGTHGKLLLGKKLERYMVELTAEVLRISGEVEQHSHTEPDCKKFIDSLHDSKMTLLKTFAQWHRISGPSADPAVGRSVGALELSTNKLITDIKGRMDSVTPVKKPPPVAQAEEVVRPKIRKDSTKEVSTLTNESNPTPISNTSITNLNNSSQTGLPEELVPDSSVPNDPSEVPQSKVTVSEYAKLLTNITPRKTGSKIGSRNRSKTGSKASSAVKLQLKIEEAEAKVEAEYNEELTARSQRKIKRDMERAKRQAREDKEEREALMRKKLAKIQVKKKIIDEYDEEQSRKSSAASLSVEEVAPSDKVAAYVNGMVETTVNSEPKPTTDKPEFTDNERLNKAAALVGNLFELEFAANSQYESRLPLKIKDPKKSKIKVASVSKVNLVGERKDITPSVKGGRLVNKSAHHSFSTVETGGLPAYTTPITDLHYAWATRPLPAPRITPSNPTTESAPFVNNKHEIKASQNQNSTPLLGDENPNLTALYPRVLPPLEQTDIKLSPSHVQNFSEAGSNNDRNNAMGAMCNQMALSRLPLSQPTPFDGKNSLQYPVWKMSFDSLINHGSISATEKLNLLNSYVIGEAKEAIQGYLLLPPSEAYEAAYNLLSRRYGDKTMIANEFKRKLRSWPKIGGTDMVGLRHFVDFLQQCHTAKRSFPALRTLDDEEENAVLTDKLPLWLSRQWARKVANHRENTEDYPSFNDFVEFLTQEDKIVHDPLFRRLQGSESIKERRKGLSFASGSSSEIPNPEESRGRGFGTCLYCGNRHPLHICEKFGSKPFEDRRHFIRDNQLCFGCLVKGHISRNCRGRKSCQVCGESHPTSMHRTGSPPTPGMSVTACASSHNAVSTPLKGSMVVPVRISHESNPNKEIETYAILDTQSDSTFITDNTAKLLGLKGKSIRLSLSTMTANEKVVRCNRFDGLVVREFSGNCTIKLPGVYSRKSIPVNRSHIPCKEMLSDWPYLNSLTHKLIPKNNFEVGLLIGYDCPKALVPKDVISSADSDDGPFGMKTNLGWGIVGIINHSPNSVDDHIGYSHRIVSNQVTGPQIVTQGCNKRRKSKTQRERQKAGKCKNQKDKGKDRRRGKVKIKKTKRKTEGGEK